MGAPDDACIIGERRSNGLERMLTERRAERRGVCDDEMTKTEMTELFAAMSLVWPQAEMFRNGVSKLGPIIALWTACLEDVDFWTAQKALVKLCRSCKFPPTIAELKEQTDAVEAEIYAEIRWACDMFRLSERLNGVDKAYEELSPDGMTRKVIDAMGGPAALLITRKMLRGDGTEQEYTEFNFGGFRRTYEQMLRRNGTGLPAARERWALTDG
ncbi:MAG: replicative helicase loader/inhibitor [Bacteroides sp.]